MKAVGIFVVRDNSGICEVRVGMLSGVRCVALRVFDDVECVLVVRMCSAGPWEVNVCAREECYRRKTSEARVSRAEL